MDPCGPAAYLIPTSSHNDLMIQSHPVRDATAFGFRRSPWRNCVTTPDIESNTRLTKFFSRNSSQRSSAGLRSGEYGGKRRGACLPARPDPYTGAKVRHREPSRGIPPGAPWKSSAETRSWFACPFVWPPCNPDVRLAAKRHRMHKCIPSSEPTRHKAERPAAPDRTADRSSARSAPRPGTSRAFSSAGGYYAGRQPARRGSFFKSFACRGIAFRMLGVGSHLAPAVTGEYPIHRVHRNPPSHLAL